MLPLWQFRPYINFVQVQFLHINRTLGGCVSRRKRVRKLKASNGSMSWKWSKRRRVATLRSKSFHINGKACLSTSTGKRLPWNWTLPPVETSFLLASGQTWASRNFNRLSGVTIRQLSIHCRSLELLPPRPSTVMSAGHTQYRFLCPNSRFESAWSGCY